MASTRHPAPTTRAIHPIGIALTACGVLVDAAIGVALLRGDSAWLLLLHPGAVALWLAGIHGIAGRWLPRDREAANGATLPETPLRQGKTVVLAVMALALFPGFGLIGWSIAAALAALPSARRAPRAPIIPVDHDATANPLPAAPDDLWSAVAVQPLIDVLREPDPALRRAAIRILSAEPSKEAVRMLRSLLVDPDPDVRSEASATLFRFENLLNRRLNDALARLEERPDRADAYADLAAGYRDYAACDLLDPASARRYLTRACDALDGATALAPERADLWLALARAQRDRGDLPAATTALAQALALAPDDADAALLSMEIAFRAQRWDTLLAIPREEHHGTTEKADSHDIFRWWAQNGPEDTAPAFSMSGAIAGD